MTLLPIEVTPAGTGNGARLTPPNSDLTWFSGECMQQRRFRPGDVLDDYCPRERRITDHAIVAMIDDNIKQTRCVVCDVEHEYKQGKVPPQRRKKTAGASLPRCSTASRGRSRPPASLTFQTTNPK